MVPYGQDRDRRRWTGPRRPARRSVVVLRNSLCPGTGGSPALASTTAATFLGRRARCIVLRPDRAPVALGTRHRESGGSRRVRTAERGLPIPQYLDAGRA